MNNIRFEIEDKTINRQTPAEWNELKQAQLLYLTPRVMFQERTETLKAQILFYLLKVRNSKLKNMNMSQLTGLFPAVEWLFSEPNLTINPFPEIKAGRKSFIGLADDMKDINVSQFAFADKFFSFFLKKKEEKYLNLLLGTIFIQKNQKFRKEAIEDNAALFSHVKLDRRLASMAFFIGSRKKATDAFSDIFSQKTKRHGHGKTGWLGFFYELAGPKIGDYKKVAEMNFFEMLGIMRKINADAREAGKRNKRR